MEASAPGQEITHNVYTAITHMSTHQYISNAPQFSHHYHSFCGILSPSALNCLQTITGLVHTVPELILGRSMLKQCSYYTYAPQHTRCTWTATYHMYVSLCAQYD